MPVTQSARKALRKDRRRAVINLRVRQGLKASIKKARAKPTEKMLAQAASALDRAAKKRVIHPNKAARLKSRLARLASRKKLARQSRPTRQK